MRRARLDALPQVAADLAENPPGVISTFAELDVNDCGQEVVNARVVAQNAALVVKLVGAMPGKPVPVSMLASIIIEFDAMLCKRISRASSIGHQRQFCKAEAIKLRAVWAYGIGTLGRAKSSRKEGLRRLRTLIRRSA